MHMEWKYPSSRHLTSATSIKNPHIMELGALFLGLYEILYKLVPEKIDPVHLDPSYTFLYNRNYYNRYFISTHLHSSLHASTCVSNLTLLLLICWTSSPLFPNTVPNFSFISSTSAHSPTFVHKIPGYFHVWGSPITFVIIVVLIYNGWLSQIL